MPAPVDGSSRDDGPPGRKVPAGYVVLGGGPGNRANHDVAARFPASEDHYVVFAHGQDGTLKVGDREVSPAELAAVITEDDNYHGQPVTLIACDTGKDPNGYANRLAQAMAPGTQVTAPSGTAWTTPDGQAFVAATAFGPDGRPQPARPAPDDTWKTFTNGRPAVVTHGPDLAHASRPRSDATHDEGNRPVDWARQRSGDSSDGRAHKRSRLAIDDDIEMTDLSAPPPAPPLIAHTGTWQEAHQAVATDLADDPTDDEHTKAVMVAAMTFKSRNASYVPLDLQSATPRQVSPLDIRNADYYFRSQQTHPSLTAASRTKDKGGPRPDQITDPALADELALRGNSKVVSGTGPQRGGAGLRPSNTDLLTQVITRDGFQKDGNPVKTPGLPLPSAGRTPAQRVDSLMSSDLANLMMATPVHPGPPPGSDPLNYIDQRMQRSRDISSYLSDAFARRPLQNIEVAGNGPNPNLTVYLQGIDNATFSNEHTDPDIKLQKDRVVEWAQVYLAGLTSSMAAAAGIPLPMQIRQSFGSLDSTLANTAESIRLSPGSEPPEFHAVVEAAIRRLDGELPGLVAAMESQAGTDHPLVHNGKWNPMSGDKKYAGWAQAVQLTSQGSGNSLIDFANWVTTTGADALGTQNDRPFLGDDRAKTLDAMRTSARYALDAAPNTYPDRTALADLTNEVNRLASGPLPIGVDLDNAIAFTGNLLATYQGQLAQGHGRFPETTSFALDQIEAAVHSATEAATTLQTAATPTQRAQAHTALRNATEDLQDAAVLLAAAVDAHQDRNPAAEAQTLVRDQLGGDSPATVHFTASGMAAITAALLTVQAPHIQVDADADAYFETHSHTRNAFKNRDPGAATGRVSDRAPLRTNLSYTAPEAATAPSDHDVRVVDVTTASDPLNPDTLRQVAAENQPGQRSLVVASLVKYYQLGADHSAQGIIVDLNPQDGRPPPAPTMVPNVRQLMSMLTDLRSSNLINFDPAIREQLGPIQDFLFAPTANRTVRQEFQSMQDLLTTLGVPSAQVDNLVAGSTFDADAYFGLLQTALSDAAARGGFHFDAAAAVQNARDNVQQHFPDQDLRSVPTGRSVETARWSGNPDGAHPSGATPAPRTVRSGISLLSSSDAVNNEHARSFADHGDAYHVFAHGTPTALTVNGEPVTAQQLATMIQQDPNWQNKPVVLISCDTGADPATGFAAQLAQALPGTRVIAPSGTAWTTSDGNATVAATTFDADGRPRPAVPTEHDQWQEFLAEPPAGSVAPRVTPLGSDLATALGRPATTGSGDRPDAVSWARTDQPAPPGPPHRIPRKPVPGTPTPQQLGLYHSNPELMYEVDRAYDVDALTTGIRDAAVSQVRARIGASQARLTPGGRDNIRVDTSAIEDALRNDLQSFFTTGGRTFEVAASRYGITTWHSVTVTPSRPASGPDGTRHGETWIDQGADKAKFDTRTDTSTAVRTNEGASDSVAVGVGGTGGTRVGPGGGAAVDILLARGGGSVETGTTTFDSHNVRSGGASHLVRSQVTFDVVAHRPGTAGPSWVSPAPVRAGVGFRVVQDIAGATPSTLAARTNGDFDVALLAENMSAVRIENATLSDGRNRPWNDVAQRILGKLGKTGVLVPGSSSSTQIRNLFSEPAVLGLLAPALESPAHSPLVVSPSRRQALGLDVSAKVTAIEPIADIGKSTFRWQPGITETTRAQQESSVGGGVSVTPIRWGFGIGFIQTRLSAAFRRTTTATAQQSTTTRLGTEHKDVENSLARVTVRVTIDPAVRLNALRHPMARTSRPIEVEMTVLARMPRNKLAEVLRPPAAAGRPAAPVAATGTPAPPFLKYGGRTVPLGMSRFAGLTRNTTSLIRDIGGGFLPKGSRGGVTSRMMRSASAVERDHNQAELDRVLSVNSLRQNYHTLLNGGTTAVLKRSGVRGDRYVVVHVTASHDPANPPVHTGTENKIAARTFQGSATSDGTGSRSQWRGAVAVEAGVINSLPSKDVSTSLTPMGGVEVQGRFDRQGGVDISGQNTALHGGTPNSERYEGPLNVKVEVYSYHVGTGRDQRSRIGLGQRVKQAGRTARTAGFTRVPGAQRVDGRPIDHYETTASQPVTLLYSRSAVPNTPAPAGDPVLASAAPPAFGKNLDNVRQMRGYVDAQPADDPPQATTVEQWQSVESIPGAALIQQMGREVAADTQVYRDGSVSRRSLGGLRGDSALRRGMPLWARVGNRLSAGRQSTALTAMTEGQWTLDPLTTSADGGELNLAVAARIVNARLVDARAEIATEHAPGGGAAVSGNRSREFLAQVRANLTLGLRKARPQADAGGAGSGGVGYQRLLRSKLIGKRSRVGGFVERNSNNRKGTNRSYLVVADMRVSVGAQVDNRASLPKSLLPSQMQPKSWQRHKSAQRSGLIRDAVYLRVSEEQAIAMGLLPNPAAPANSRPVAAATAQDVNRHGVRTAPGRSPGQGLQLFRNVPSLINPATTALRDAVHAAAPGSPTRELLEPVLNTLQGDGLPDPMLNRRHLENMLSRDGVQRSWGALFDGGVSLIHTEPDLVSQRLYDVRLEATLPTPEQFEKFVADNEDIDVRTIGSSSSSEQVRTGQGGQVTIGGTGATIIDPDGKRVTVGGGHGKSYNSQTSTTTSTEIEHRTVDITSGRGVKARMRLQPQFQIKVYHRGRAVPEGTVTFSAPVTVDRWAGDLRLGDAHTPASLTGPGAYRPTAEPGPEPGWERAGGLLIPPKLTPEGLSGAKDVQAAVSTLLSDASKRLATAGYPGANQIRTGLSPELLVSNTSTLLSNGGLELPPVPAADALAHEAQLTVRLRPLAARLAGIDSKVFREHSSQTVTSAGTVVSAQQWSSSAPRFQLGQGYVGEPSQALDTSGGGPTAGDSASQGQVGQSGSSGSAITKPESASALVEYVVRPEVVAKLSSALSSGDPIVTRDDGTTATILVRMSLADARRVLGIDSGAPSAAAARFNALVLAEQNLDTAATTFTAAAEAAAAARYANPGTPVPQALLDAEDRAEADWWSNALGHYQGLDDFQHSFVAVGDTPNLARYNPLPPTPAATQPPPPPAPTHLPAQQPQRIQRKPAPQRIHRKPVPQRIQRKPVPQPGPPDASEPTRAMRSGPVQSARGARPTGNPPASGRPLPDLSAARAATPPRTANTTSFDVVDRSTGQSRPIPDAVLRSYQQRGLTPPTADRPAIDLTHVRGVIAYDHRVLNLDGAYGPTPIQDFTVKIHLDPQDATAATQVDRVQRQAKAAVEQTWNQGLTIGPGHRLNVNVEFTTDPAEAHTTIKLFGGNPPGTTQTEWPTTIRPIEIAHEVGHYLGLPDEYHETGPDARVLLSRPTNSGVHHDNGLMELSDPDSHTGVRPRHRQKISDVAQAALPPDHRPTAAAGHDGGLGTRPTTEPAVLSRSGPATGTRAAPQRLVRRRSTDSSDSGGGQEHKKSRVDRDGDVEMTDVSVPANPAPPATTAMLVEHTTVWQQAHQVVAADLAQDPTDDEHTKAVMVAAMTYKSRNASYLPLDLQSPEPRQVSPYDIRTVDYYFRSQSTHPALAAANRTGTGSGADQLTDPALADELTLRGNPSLASRGTGPQRGGAGLRPSNTDLLTRRITRDGFQRRGNPVQSAEPHTSAAGGRTPAERVNALLDSELAKLMGSTPPHPDPPAGADPLGYIDQRMQRAREVSQTLRTAFATRPLHAVEVHDNGANPNASLYLAAVDRASFDPPGTPPRDAFKKDQLVEWVQVYLAGLTSSMAAAAGVPLPMHIRQSFGSLDSTLANTAESIRLSPGSEPPEFTAVVEAAIRRLDAELPTLISLMESQSGTGSALLQSGRWKPNSGDKKYAGWAQAVQLTSGQPEPSGNSLIDFAHWVTSTSAADLGAQSSPDAKRLLQDARTRNLDTMRADARAALDGAHRTYPDRAALAGLTNEVDRLATGPLPIAVDLDNAIAFTGNLLAAYQNQLGSDHPRFPRTTGFALDQIEAAVRSAAVAARALHGPATAAQRAQAHTALRNATEDLQDAAVLLAAAVDAHQDRNPATEAQTLIRDQLGGDSRATVHFTASGMAAITAALLTAQTPHVQVDTDPDAYFEVDSHTKNAFRTRTADGARARVSDRAPLRTTFAGPAADAATVPSDHPLRVVDVTTASDPLNPDTLRQVAAENQPGQRSLVVASLVKYYQLGADHSAQGIIVDLNPQDGRPPPAPTMVPNVRQLMSMLTDLRSSNLINFDPAIRPALGPIGRFLFAPDTGLTEEQEVRNLHELLAGLGGPVDSSAFDGDAYLTALQNTLATIAAEHAPSFDAAAAVDRARVNVARELAVRVPAGLALLPPGDTANEQHAEAYPGQPGAYHVFAHGTPDALTVDGYPITARQLAALIREDPAWQAQPIVLISCDTGADPDTGFAAQLAQALPGVRILAPSGTAWTTPDGGATVAGTAFDADGRPRPAASTGPDQWREFLVEPPATTPRVTPRGATLGPVPATGRSDAVSWTRRRPASSSPERSDVKRPHRDADPETADPAPEDVTMRDPLPALAEHTLTWQQGHAAVVADLAAGRGATPEQTKAVMVAAMTYKSHNASYVPLDLQSPAPRQVSPWDIRVPDKYFRSQDQSPALTAARETGSGGDRAPKDIGDEDLETRLRNRGNPAMVDGSGPERGGAGLRPSNTDLLTRTIDHNSFVNSGNPRGDAGRPPDPASRPPASRRVRELQADLLDLIQQTPGHPTDATGLSYLDQRVQRSRAMSDDLVGRLGHGLSAVEVAGNDRNPNVTIHLRTLADAEIRKPAGRARRVEKGRVVEWVQVYLAGLTSAMAAAAGVELPMHIRQSFGSLDSTLADTGPSIRYSPGSEPPEFIAVLEAAVRRLDQELPALITVLTDGRPNARVLDNGNWNTVSGDKKYAGWAQAAVIASGALGHDGNGLVNFVQWVTTTETDKVLGKQDDDHFLDDARTRGLERFREKARAALDDAARTYPDRDALGNLRGEVNERATGPLPITVDLDNAIAFANNLLAGYAGQFDRPAFPATTHFALDQLQNAVLSVEREIDALNSVTSSPAERARLHTVLRNATEDLQDAALLLAAAVDAHADRDPAGEAQALARTLLGANSPATVHFTASGMQAITAALLTAGTGGVDLTTDTDAYFETQSHTRRAFEHRPGPARPARVSDLAPLHTDPRQRDSRADTGSDDDLRVIDVTTAGDPLDGALLRQVAGQRRPGQRVAVVASLVKYYQLGADHSAQGIIVDLDPDPAAPAPAPTMVANVRQLLSMLTDLRTSNAQHFDPAVHDYLPAIARFLFTPVGESSDEAYTGALLDLLHGLGTPREEVAALIGTSPAGEPTFDAYRFFELLSQRLDAATPDYTGLDVADENDVVTAHDAAGAAVRRLALEQPDLRSVPLDGRPAHWSGEASPSSVRTPVPHHLDTGLVLLGSSDTVNSRHAEVFPGDPGAYHVFAHGTPHALTVDGEPVTPQQLAAMIRQDPNWRNRPVVLISCDTGADPVAGFAARLAQALPGTRVIAPSGTTWTTADGGAVVASGFDPSGRPRVDPADRWQSFLVEPPADTVRVEPGPAVLGRPDPRGPAVSWSPFPSRVASSTTRSGRQLFRALSLLNAAIRSRDRVRAIAYAIASATMAASAAWRRAELAKLGREAAEAVRDAGRNVSRAGLNSDDVHDLAGEHERSGDGPDADRMLDHLTAFNDSAEPGIHAETGRLDAVATDLENRLRALAPPSVPFDSDPVRESEYR